MSFHVESEFGIMMHASVSQMSLEDAIILANLLRDSDSGFLQRFGLEIESELMELSN